MIASVGQSIPIYTYTRCFLNSAKAQKCTVKVSCDVTEACAVNTVKGRCPATPCFSGCDAPSDYHRLCHHMWATVWYNNETFLCTSKKQWPVQFSLFHLPKGDVSQMCIRLDSTSLHVLFLFLFAGSPFLFANINGTLTTIILFLKK